ncbi:MAG: genX [Deltaproteobacteria bacterium]|nr:genX [Deltaproteobacteria bacterium]
MLAAKKARLTERARIIQNIRSFFVREGYLEIDTPLLLPTVAPEAYIDPVAAGSDFLQTSPELCMKRLAAAGYERIFQLAHCWRERERGTLHLPEFTMLEWYRADSDYRWLMSETSSLLRYLVHNSTATEVLSYQGKTIDLSGEWEQLPVREAFSRFGGVSMEEALRSDDFDRVMVERIEPELGKEKPVFLYDYPACRSALARLKESDPSVAERFELYIAGIELANGFSELIDPVEQRRRFLHDNAQRHAAGVTVLPLPERFLAEMASMPQTAGIALGVDRLVMLLTDAGAIDAVVTFTPEEL